VAPKRHANFGNKFRVSKDTLWRKWWAAYEGSDGLSLLGDDSFSQALKKFGDFEHFFGSWASCFTTSLLKVLANFRLDIFSKLSTWAQVHHR
jgi:hypothetical protein